MKIGFIGLGIMGRPMAQNLAAAGHELVVLERHASHLDGAETAGTPREVAERSDLVLTMLPDSPQVREVLLGEDGVLAGAGGRETPSVVVDMSSIDPLVTRDLAERADAAGVRLVDAPVSGGEPMAVAGTLTFMVGGPEDVVEAVRPVLDAMGASVTRVGEVGAGNIAKLANQAIVAVNIAVLAEALVLAQKAGVDAEDVLAAVQGGLAGSNVMKAKGPMMLEHRFTPGFRVGLHLKDLANVMATSHAVGSPMPLTATALELMIQLRAHGHEGEDHSALLRTAEAASDVVLGAGSVVRRSFPT